MKTKGHIITDEQFEEYNELKRKEFEKTHMFYYKEFARIHHGWHPTSRRIEISCNDNDLRDSVIEKLSAVISVNDRSIEREINKYKKYYQLSLDSKKRVDKLMKSTSIWRFLKLRRRFNRIHK